VNAGLFTVDSAAQITATVPAGAVSGPIAVTTPAGAASSATSLSVLAPPANDNFAGAQVLTGDSGSATGSNVGATLETGEPRHADLAGGKSVWYRWTAPRDGTWSFDTFGSGFDTRLAVYTGNTLATLALLASNDDTGSSTNSSVTFKGAAATAYYVAVDGSNEEASQPGNAASGVIKINWKILASPPTISGFTPATAIVGSTITINGANFTGATSVQFNGVNTASFEVLSQSQITALVPAGARNGPISVTTPVGTGTSAASFTLAVGPNNDQFANAQVLTGATGKVSGTNEAATKEPGEPDHAEEAGGRSVWFVWTAPNDGTWTFHTHGSSFDTVMAVYTGSTLATLRLVVSNDDASVGSTSSVTFPATAGTIYRIAVDGYVGLSGKLDLSWIGAGNVPAINSFSPSSGNAGTVITIEGVNLTGATAVNFTGAAATSFTAVSSSRITVTVPTGATTGPITVRTPNGLAISAAQFTLVAAGPSNNNFADAAVLSGPAATITGNNVGATKEANEPNHADDRGGKSVWYRWTAPTTGTWKISTASSQFDTTMAVYTGDAVNTLKLVTDNDDAGEDATSEVTLRGGS